MELSVHTRSGRTLTTLKLGSDASLDDLKKAYYATNKKCYPERQRFTLPSANPSQKGVVLVDGKSLKDQGVKTSVVFKDLGPQISWKAVFIIEYLGPLLIYPIFFMRPEIIYGKNLPPMLEQQQAAFAAFIFHYAKRELETLFLHRFSNSTMPIMNVFKNSIYYWGFAAGMAYFMFHPLYTPAPEAAYLLGTGLFYGSEVANFVAHLILANLRPKGTKIRKIPEGAFFELVSCPNYTFEISAWFGYNLMTSTLIGWLFFTAGTAQMLVWAQKKHAQYLKEFDGKNGRPLYPPERRILIPYIY